MWMNRTNAGSRRSSRARRLLLFAAAFLFVGGVGACDFLDPTDVENPQTTEEDLATAAEPVRALLPGLRAQAARLVGSSVTITEVVSDNYSIQGTGINPIFDNPRSVGPSVIDGTSAVQGIYWNSQELRALADFVLNEIAPQDETATASQTAEVHYLRGLAYLVQGENFSHVPTELDGQARPAEELLQRAVTDFEASLGQDAGGPFAVASRAGLARAHRLLGDGVQATQAAEQVLAADPSFLFTQDFDASSVVNSPNNYVVQRSLKEMQPLPRLDFLDPKYVGRESPIAVAKAEEMHLIVAEAALAAGDLDGARERLSDAIQVAESRPVDSWTDDDPRFNTDLTPRPRDSEILVRADPDSPFRAGLVLDRPNVEIPVHPVSATSLSADSVRALGSEDEVWHALHLARQEILFLEGRRMSDLGIRLPMMLREIDSNPNVQPGEPGTEPVVPAYVPSGVQMNQFDPASPYDQDENLVTTEVTIGVDMNRVLTENRVSPFLN